jgi:hypothetical protein
MSYRKISAELATRGHLTGDGKPHVPSAIQKTLGRSGMAAGQPFQMAANCVRRRNSIGATLTS